MNCQFTGVQSRRLLLFAIAFFSAIPLHLPASADETVKIPNTASANFSLTPGGPLQPAITSNPVSVTATVGQANLEVIKTGDRAAAEPGDTVIYRLLVKNTGTAAVTNLVIQDTLPLGLDFLEKSPRAALGSGGAGTSVPLASVTRNKQVVNFSFASLAPGQTLTLAYAAVLTPDAIRGTGRNLALAQGRSGTRDVKSNTASHLLRIRPGLLSDCATLVGRVFVDKNFDGEQQPGEPGVPNAVIFLDDGNRVVTDANGLFSLAYVISGNRVGTLDLTSLPGYTLAPNRYRIEANSTSRLVRLSPGSMGRMNFAVTPAFKEGQR